MVSGTAVVIMRTVPIHERLNRIRWDAEFARGNFELGYFDRIEERIIAVHNFALDMNWLPWPVPPKKR